MVTEIGAGEEIRTLDPDRGKVSLHGSRRCPYLRYVAKNMIKIEYLLVQTVVVISDFSPVCYLNCLQDAYILVPM